VANVVVQDYFTHAAWLKAAQPPAKVITCVAMFYDLEKPDAFIADMHKVLRDDGVVVLQMSYTPLMLAQLAFDNICHEHFYYHSLSSLKKLFERNGFRLIEANLNDANGGSVRAYFCKTTLPPTFFATEPWRQVCEYRVDALLRQERQVDISDPAQWRAFETKLRALRDEVVTFIRKVNAEGKKV
jgi:hypothetical protein